MKRKAKPALKSLRTKRTARKAGVKGSKWVTAEKFARLQQNLQEVQETLDAIRAGEVDAVVVNGTGGAHVYSLTGAEQPYRVYVERMQEGAVTISADGVILYANHRFAEMVGKPLRKVISAKASSYLDASAWQRISKVFGSRKVVIKCETRLQRSDCSSMPVTLTASLLPYEGHDFLCLVVTDLSGQKQNEELRLAKEVAEKASAAKDTFLAALSHELRTPLNPVLLLSSDAAENPNLPPEVRGDFETIRKHIELESRLIDDLLDLTRITHGKMILDRNLIDGHAALRNAIATIKPDLERKNISLTVTCETKVCSLNADAVRLQQVFWNVLKNAVKFTPANGTIRVSTRAVPAQKQWVVRVTDSGIGMTSAELAHAFETFAQGDHAKGCGPRQFGGLGLGLSISHKIVRLHQGEMTALSDGRGKGSTFVIELPLAQPAVVDDRDGAPANESKVRQDLKGINILLVEDHEPTRAALSRLLVRRNHVVLAAATAREARDLVEKNRFDVVISDIGLPDESGFDLMKELNDRYQLKGIALTGYGAEQDVVSSRNSGFLSHLTKPIRMESLEAALAAAMSATMESLKESGR